MSASIYASPRTVTDLAACHFYHTMEIPGYGLVQGEWDLRPGVDAYLGGINLQGKRVLELGTASGFLCIEMEQRGAEVVAYDLDPDHAWDIVPFAGFDFTKFMPRWSAHIARLNNGFWLNHAAHHSHARMVYGSIYNVPPAIGTVDIATFGSVLLHLRDPFLSLQRGTALARETVIITDVLPRPRVVNNLPARLRFLARYLQPTTIPIEFLPDPNTAQPLDTWWNLSPELIVRMIGVLGFGRANISHHTQSYQGHPARLYTVVGHRTKPAPQI